MNLCYEYSIKWRYEFHNDKSSIVTFGETKRIHCQSIKQRNRVLDNEIVDERYEYKNLGVVKNYADSFSSNVEDNIDKIKAMLGMLGGGESICGWLFIMELLPLRYHCLRK